MIREATPADGEALAAIYKYYIEETHVTFEETAVSAEEMANRVTTITKHGYPWFVFEENDEVIGYSYAGTWKPRSAYRFTVEGTVYLKHGSEGRGIGTQLYQRLLDTLKERSIHLVIGGIALPNEASVALHEKLGFTKAAHFREQGRKFGRWIDVGYWERLL